MPANQMTLTMISESAIGWHSKPGAESLIIVNVI
jgi:hypothetical protein